MDTLLDSKLNELLTTKKKWLVTGCAGFIGSNLVEKLLTHGQTVIGVDNFITGKKENIQELNELAINTAGDFAFVEGDVTDRGLCREVVAGVDVVLHQAAVGSVPRSIKKPIVSHDNNVNGMLYLLDEYRKAGGKRFVYASSSAVYGDSRELPKVEKNIGNPLSPYAVTKKINEIYAEIYCKTYGMKCVGIRYFNVFGKRQDFNSTYSAVIPTWLAAMINEELVVINGDGETSRDFCYIDNVIFMNVLAGLTANSEAFGKVYNCAAEHRTTLNELYDLLDLYLSEVSSEKREKLKEYADFRPGDVRHSHANCSLAREDLGYIPLVQIKEGIEKTIHWYVQKLTAK